MRVLLHSYTFLPSIGGIEDISHAMAQGFTAAGLEVTVVTETPASEEIDVPYKIVRNPSPQERRTLIASHDLVYVNGSATSCFQAAWRFHKPFVWTHQGYQLKCLDGAGWLNGNPAPLDPMSSFALHCRTFGPVQSAASCTKLMARKMIAHLAASNIAPSLHMTRRQPLPRQTVIYNIADWKQFSATAAAAEQALEQSDAAFTYLGRLVSEKGADDLLHAFALLKEASPDNRELSLKIIGDGSQRPALEELSRQLGIADQVRFLGAKTGRELVEEIERCGICVLPSAWEEPGAVTPLNLMAAGKPLIVSEYGSLSEYCGNAASTFPNRDRAALARAMGTVFGNPSLQKELLHNALLRIRDFEPEKLIDQYIKLFEKIRADNRI